MFESYILKELLIYCVTLEKSILFIKINIQFYNLRYYANKSFLEEVPPQKRTWKNTDIVKQKTQLAKVKSHFEGKRSEEDYNLYRWFTIDYQKSLKYLKKTGTLKRIRYQITWKDKKLKRKRFQIFSW